MSEHPSWGYLSFHAERVVTARLARYLRGSTRIRLQTESLADGHLLASLPLRAVSIESHLASATTSRRSIASSCNSDPATTRRLWLRVVLNATEQQPLHRGQFIDVLVRDNHGSWWVPEHSV